MNDLDLRTLTPDIEARCILIGDPLDGGEDPIRYVSDKFATGRAEYQCMYCMRMIPKGERHRVIVAIVDAEWGAARYCAECCVAQALEWSNGDESLNRYLDRYAMFEVKP